jgi:nucleotide-binding universal stress UspA family protein
MESARDILEAASDRSGALGEAAPPLRLLVDDSDEGSDSRDALALANALSEGGEAELAATSRRALDDGHETTGLKELAEAESSDVIVLGSRYRAPAARGSSESVGERVLDGAPCAVAIAPQGLAEGDPSIREIAVGYDGSRASTVALRRAIRLAERSNASLLVLGAVEISLGLAGFETERPKNLQQSDMEHHLKRALEMVPPAISAQSRLLFGPPGRAILDAARGADLLVLGSRGSYSILRRLALGSVGREAMRGATCPTLITPTDF